MIDVSIKALRELGICLYNNQREMKPLQELMEEIKDAYYKINPELKPLLTIELESENSIPKVFYKGEEITNRTQISFDWVTSGARNFGGMEFLIKHADEKGIAHTIGKSRGNFL